MSDQYLIIFLNDLRDKIASIENRLNSNIHQTSPFNFLSTNYNKIFIFISIIGHGYQYYLNHINSSLIMNNKNIINNILNMTGNK